MGEKQEEMVHYRIVHGAREIACTMNTNPAGGSIVFSTGGRELLRFGPDGAVTLRGEAIGYAKDILDGLREFLQTGNSVTPNPIVWVGDLHGEERCGACAAFETGPAIQCNLSKGHGAIHQAGGMGWGTW